MQIEEFLALMKGKAISGFLIIFFTLLPLVGEVVVSKSSSVSLEATRNDGLLVRLSKHNKRENYGDIE